MVAQAYKGKKNIFLKVLAVIILVLVLLLGLAVIFNSEIRSFLMFKIAPNYAKEAHFVKLQNLNGQEIYLLGTTHGDLLTSQDYSLLHIQSVIEKLNPSLLLVESRPSELARGNLADGPIEMLFANLTAKALKIKVDGMDWWQKGVRGSNEIRERKMFENILSRIKGEKRVLVLTGYSHVAAFAEYFKLEGFEEVDFSDKKPRLFDASGRELVFPSKMISYIQKRIDLETEELKKEKDEETREMLKDSIEMEIERLKIITGKTVEKSRI